MRVSRWVNVVTVCKPNHWNENSTQPSHGDYDIQVVYCDSNKYINKIQLIHIIQLINTQHR